MTDQWEYVLGMEPAEIERLRRQHEIWREATAKVWSLAGFRPGQTIVDLGSGPGVATIDLARIVAPSGRVVAIDSSARARIECQRLVRESRLQNIEVQDADATHFDASAWQPDGIFARWLFSYLSNPEAVVRAIAGGLRPGATFAVMDYWNYLAIEMEPKSPLFARVYRAVYDSVLDTGGSFDTAGRLPSIFEASGFKVTETEVFSRVGRPGSPLWAWLSDFQRLYLPTLVAKGYLSSEDIQAFWDWWEALESTGSALLFAPPILGIVGVKTV